MTVSQILRPVSQKPRYKLVAESIAESIRAGALRPGSKMPTDRELIAQLGVSRTTVREAMIALELMGYVETRYGSGAYVAREIPAEHADLSTLPGYFELVEARIAFEPEIAATAARSIGRAELDHLRACIDGMCREPSPLAEIERFDREFHLAVARATGNAIFVQVVDDFWRVRRQFPEWTRLNNRRGPEDIAKFSRQEHERIVEALVARDAAAARAAMQVHCRNSGQPLLDRWRQLEDEGGAPESSAVGRMLGRNGPGD